MIGKKCIESGDKVAILGLGVSGKAAAKYVLACGAEVIVSDLRPEAQFFSEEKSFLEQTQVIWESGGHSIDFLVAADTIIASPGVDLNGSLLRELKSRGVRIVGELAVVANQFDIPVLAVTGTNGKTTVTTLIGEILREAGKEVFIGGNIGTPLYEYFLSKKKYDFIVAELSSFQLENAGDFSPDIGVLLNISPDHLDRHGTLEEYVAAKMNLFAHQKKGDLCIINGDDPYCRNLESGLQCTVQSFGQTSRNTLLIQDDRFVMRVNGQKEVYQFPKGPVGDFFTGFHLQNYGAAALALHAAGCSLEEIMEGFKRFKRPLHRLALVGESVDGVKYFNDSKATNTGAVLAALGTFETSVVLIAGGRDKGDDYSLLLEAVKEKVSTLILLGEAAALIERDLGNVTDVIKVATMEEAVAVATQKAVPGEVVLLSPACASFDMFTSYSHRGDVFSQAVRKQLRI